MNRFSFKYTLLCQRTSEERTFGRLMTKEFGIPEPVGELLHSRGITTLDQAQEFLYPHLSMLPSPDRMKDMDKAVTCIINACNEQQPIFIHGDYDVDGISATALLISFFTEIGQRAYYYIPNRLKEAYGLSFASIDRLLAQCPGQGGVLISVDCGITAVEEVEYAQHQGLRVVITDHHEAPEQLPLADAILNPKQPGCTFPCSFLSGVGVAFFLLIALRRAMGLSLNLKKYLDFVALGTVADVVPLQGVNRILVRSGLEVISSKHRLGVDFLCRKSGLTGREALSEDISFRLAPRMNAGGRLGNPSKGVELLLAETATNAQMLAEQLETMNLARKQLEASALAVLQENYQEQLSAQSSSIILYHPDCHVGVLGILASRLVDRCGRPVLVFSDDVQNASVLRGSGRSIQGINLYHVLEECAASIEQFGGHAMAVGLSVRRENLSQFKRDFDEQIKRMILMIENRVHTTVDYFLPNANMLSTSFANALQMMQPFGEGNHEPCLLLAEQHLLRTRSRNGHLLFQLQGGEGVLPGIGFNLAEEFFDCPQRANLIFHLKRSWFKGVERTQIQALELHRPDRDSST